MNIFAINNNNNNNNNDNMKKNMCVIYWIMVCICIILEKALFLALFQWKFKFLFSPWCVSLRWFHLALHRLPRCLCSRHHLVEKERKKKKVKVTFLSLVAFIWKECILHEIYIYSFSVFLKKSFYIKENFFSRRQHIYLFMKEN